jgi:signal transduction histidine kinase/PAS domain-containing protein
MEEARDDKVEARFESLAFRRLWNLQTVTEAAFSTLHLDELLPPIVGRVAQVFGADAVLIMLKDHPDEPQLVVRAAFGVEPHGERLGLGDTLPGRLFIEGRAMRSGDPGVRDLSCPILRAHGVRSFLGAPLRANGLTLGTITLGTLRDRRFSDDELSLLTFMGERIALGIDHASLREATQRAGLRAERAEARYRGLVEKLRHAIVWEADPQTLGLRFVSATAMSLLGYEEPPAGDSPVRFDSWVHPDDSELVVRSVADARAQVVETSCEHRAVAADGRVRWFRTSFQVESGEGEEVLRGLSLEITQLKRREETQRFLAAASDVLAQSLDYETTLTRLAGLTLPVLADWCMVDMLTEDGSLGRLVSQHVDPAQQPLAAKARSPQPAHGHPIYEAIRGGRPVLHQPLPDGLLQALGEDAQHLAVLEELHVRALLFVPLTTRGRNIGAITLALTSDGRRYEREDLQLAEELGRRAAVAVDNARLYQEAQRAIRVREEVLAVVSHDLKNPLSSVSMNSLLIAGLAPADSLGERIRGLAGACRGAARRMDRLIEDLLDFASIQAGRLSLSPAQHGLGGLLEEAREMMMPLANEKRIRFDLELPEEALDLRCDRDRILQVLSNLVGNAIKFTPANGAVTLSVEPSATQVTFTLADTGPGISPEQLPRIFDRYWRADRTARRGAGLGLAIAKAIVEAHGGRIWADSRLGDGTRVHFTIPRGAPPRRAS